VRTSFFGRMIYIDFTAGFNIDDYQDWYDIYTSRLSIEVGQFSTSVYAANLLYSSSDDPYKGGNRYGFNVVYKVDKLNKLYFETFFFEAYTFPVSLNSVAGISCAIFDAVTVTAEIQYIGKGMDFYLEALHEAPFGWQGWDATLSSKYIPNTKSNFAILFGLRNTIARIFQYEFRYGYESAGNHRIDINLRLFQDFGLVLFKDEKTVPIPVSTYPETKPVQ
jgi:hypothetical protein